jgi:hypothetical protein
MVTVARDAGGSAAREYERRRGRERAAKVAALPIVLSLIIATAVVVFVVTLVVAGNFDVPTGQATLLALVLSASAVSSLAIAAWGRRQSTEAWRIGAEGERLTATRLVKLERRGFVALHDRRIPSTRANIDHVVIGPTGIHTLETKNYGGKVTLRFPLLFGAPLVTHNGRRLDGVIAQAQSQASVVARALDGESAADSMRVKPVVVVHRASLSTSWFRRPVVEGVEWCTGDRLVRVLTRGPKVLSGPEVQRVAKILDDRLALATERASRHSRGSDTTVVCSCGAPMVARQRRADGAAFLGCSRYPACRHTQPLPST